MNMKRTSHMLVLLTALLVTAAVSFAGLPAQEANIWAPTGDLVGKTNHGTVTMTVLDGYGFEPKASEDWQLNDKYSSSLLFGWHTAGENGQLVSLRSFGGNRLDGNIGGHLTFATVQPGRWGFAFDYRGFDHHYDTTSEMRAASFAGTMPPMLDMEPGMNWNRANFTMKYHVNSAWHIDGGFGRMNRSGDKSSLARGAIGSAVPALRVIDNRTNSIWMRVNYARKAMAAKVRFEMRDTDGMRSHDAPHSYVDDQKLWNLTADASYDVNANTRVLAGGQFAKLENTQTEQLGSTSYAPDSEAKTTAGQLGVITKLGKATTVKLTGQFKKQDTEGQTLNDDLSIAQGMTRDRNSTLFQAKVATMAMDNAKVQVHYKYSKSDLEEIVALDNLPGVATDFQTTDQERTKQNAGFKLRYRFNRKAYLKGSLGWTKTEITETSVGEDILYKMGDRDLNQLKYELALGLKPTGDLRLDLGLQAIDQTYDRLDEEVETTWATQRGYVMANWTVMPKLSILASASLGVDKYELTDGPVATSAMSPLMYEGTTLRYAPGVVYSFNDKLTLEAIYEGINFEDEGDDEANKLTSDSSRFLVRAGYDVGDEARLTASYRRQEFDENRWDDYILDIYSLSVSGKF